MGFYDTPCFMDCCLIWPGTVEGLTNGIPEPAAGCVPTPGAGGCLELCAKATALRWLLIQLPWALGAPFPWSLEQLEKDRFPPLNDLRQHASGPGMKILGGDEGNLSVWDASPRQGPDIFFSTTSCPFPLPRRAICYGRLPQLLVL